MEDRVELKVRLLVVIQVEQEGLEVMAEFE
jgi:hypothetical protein